MLFRHSLTIPANTTENDPVTEMVSVIPGVLTVGSVTFPPGCAGLVHVNVLDLEHQIVPANIGSYLSGDNLTITWPDDTEIKDVPFMFKLVGWSDDDTYPHRIVFRFAIMGKMSTKQELARAEFMVLFGL